MVYKLQRLLCVGLLAAAASASGADVRDIAPYYASPPGDSLVQAQCGPEHEWSVIDVRTSEDALLLRQKIRSGIRAVVRVHWRAAPYPHLTVKGGRCVKVLGISGPRGQKPLVTRVSATRALRDQVRPGGVIIQNLEVSPGKAYRMDPTVRPGGDCLGVPNDQYFFIIRDSDVTRCGHHAFVTGHAHQLYVEIGRSHFAQAWSHLAYIDHVGMAYVYDSTFESPGWGHALRSIALRTVIERVKVSNVQLDGSVLPVGGDNPLRPRQNYIGMAPLEIYVCGQSEVRDTDIVLRADKHRNGLFAAVFRERDAFNVCDVGEVKNGKWTPLRYGDPDYFNPQRWSTVTPLLHSVTRARVHCVGPEPCWGWAIKGTHPVMNNHQQYEFQRWLRDNKFASWTALLQAIPADRKDWKWIASVTLPTFRNSLLRGTVTNKIPLPVPLSGWFQRTRIRFTDVTVSSGQLLRPLQKPDTYCYGVPPRNGECVEQDTGKHYRTGFVDIRN